jgi:hypothetical protein
MNRRLLALFGVLVIAFAACSRSDNGSNATTGSTSSTSAPSSGKGLAAGAFGDLGVICKPGNAKPITGQTGINGTTISLGTVSDRGFSGSPGLDEEFNDLADAFTAWCDAHGGVQGYKLKNDNLDAKITEYQNRIIEACDKDFALVGGGGALDSAQKPRLACGLPDFPAYVVTDEAVNSDLHVTAVPNGGGTWASGDFRWIAQHFPGTTQHVASLYGDYATTQTVDARNKEVMASLGWKVVNSQSYAILGESNWTPFAQAMKDKGVQGVVWVGEPQNLAKFLQAAQTINFHPQWVRADANGYDTKYTSTGGTTVDGTYIRSIFWPLERASENPATQQYLDMMKQYKPGGKIALLGEQGLSAWLLFVTSLNKCIDAGTLTRDCVYSTAKKVTSWTGGGLHAKDDPASEKFSDCYTIIQTKGGKFVNAKVDANFDRIYNCDPKNVFVLKNNGMTAGIKCTGQPDPLPSNCGK